MTNNTTNISIRMDSELKKQADLLFEELGMNITTAFNIFAKAVVRERRIPFEIASPEKKEYTRKFTYKTCDDGLRVICDISGIYEIT